MKYFGTDGIRGKADIFTKEFIYKIAKSLATVVACPRIMIARDTRSSGLVIQNYFIESLTCLGAIVTIAGMTATPVLAYLTKSYNQDFGIMISASHNPPEYNGIKIFNSMGSKIASTLEERLAELIDTPEEVKTINGAYKYIDGDSEYIEHFCSMLNPKIAGLKVCLDTANGATSIIAPRLFKMLGANVVELNQQLDGSNINVNCGATNPEYIQSAMAINHAEIGFSFDGDGDRVIAVCNNKILDGDHLMYIHALDMQRRNQLNKNTVVGTIMSNLGTQNALNKHQINFERTQVGDKFVSSFMSQQRYNLGGEQSGHIIFSDYNATGDGILCSLLTAMIAVNTSLDDIDDIIEYPQVSKDFVCTADEIERYRRDNSIDEFVKEVSSTLDGRAIVRPSGTEPKVRIMVEARLFDEAEQIASEIADFIVERIKI